MSRYVKLAKCRFAENAYAAWLTHTGAAATPDSDTRTARRPDQRRPVRRSSYRRPGNQLAF